MLCAALALKILKVKKRARALRFLKPLPDKAYSVALVAETTNGQWVKPRVYPQEKVGETTCLSTEKVGETTNSLTAFLWDLMG